MTFNQQSQNDVVVCKYTSKGSTNSNHQLNMHQAHSQLRKKELSKSVIQNQTSVR